MLEITHEYKTMDSSSPERWAVIASCRGYQRLQQYYEYPDRNYEDVYFELMDIDLVPYGQPFDCTMNIQVRQRIHCEKLPILVLHILIFFRTEQIQRRSRNMVRVDRFVLLLHWRNSLETTQGSG